MAIRNFWIRADIDGRKNLMEGGPASQDGGFILHVKMREAETITTPLTIQGRANDDGTLSLVLVAKPGTFNITEDEAGIMLRRVVTR